MSEPSKKEKKKRAEEERTLALNSGVLPDASLSSYRDGVRVLTRLVILGAGIILGLTALLMSVVMYGHPEDNYYVLSFDDHKTPLDGFPDPSTNINALLAWSSTAVTQVMTFGFSDVNERFSLAEGYFTKIGWESFGIAIRDSRLLRTLVEQQQLMTAIPVGVPIVKYQGWVKGGYIWDVQVPVVLTIRAGGSEKSAWPMIVIRIKKVPTSQNASGLGIEKWVML